MAHAGTMDLGRNAQTKPSGNPWPLLGLAVAAVAIIAAVWFASSAGLVGGQLAAKPADRSYDAIEAQRGAMLLVTDRNYDPIEAHRVALGVAAPVCRSFSPTSGQAFNVTCKMSSAEASQIAASGGWYGQRYAVPNIYIPPTSIMVQPGLDAKAAIVLNAAEREAQYNVSRYPFIVPTVQSSAS